jgi:hypothetical protein
MRSAHRIGRPAVLVAALALVGGRRAAVAAETITPLANLPASADTCCKPQSKVWFHGGYWWAIMPSTSASPSGSWVWRLEPNHTWTSVVRLSTLTNTHADARVVDDLIYVLLYGSSPAFAVIRYVPGTPPTYALLARCPTNPPPVSLPGSETATIDVDTNARVWLSTEGGSNVLVRYSDPPYCQFLGPIMLASDIASDDITVVTAMHPVPPDPAVPPKIGVLWSNQKTEKFYFQTHLDSESDPFVWEPQEIPPAVRKKMADDHLHVAMGSDGTLYAAVKTSAGPPIGFLRRHPDGTWDRLVDVDTIGTRAIVLLNEPADLLRIIYSSDTGGGNIVYRDSLLSTINFGPRKTLMTGSLNNVTSTKDNWTDQVVVLASGRGALFSLGAGGPTTTTSSTTTSTIRTTTSTVTTTTNTIAPPPTSTTTSSVTTTSTAGTTTSTSLPPTGGTTSVYQAGVSGPADSANVDTNVRLSTLDKAYGSDPNLYVGVTNGPDKVYRTVVAFNLAGIPAGAAVSACTLRVNVTQRTKPTAGHIRRLCGEHWLDGDGQSEAQATWSVWKTGSTWMAGGMGSAAACAAGGDYTTDGEVAYTPPGGTGPFTFPDLTALCQDAVATRGGWLRLRLSQDAETAQSNLFKFDSSDASTAANRPRLSVTWSVP